MDFFEKKNRKSINNGFGIKIEIENIQLFRNNLFASLIDNIFYEEINHALSELAKTCVPILMERWAHSHLHIVTLSSLGSTSKFKMT